MMLFHNNVVVKTLRVSEKTHKDMVVIQSKMQIKKGEIISMNQVLTKIIQFYKTHGSKMK